MPGPLTVLIAEDNSSDRFLLETVLKRQGHRVLSASDGAQAVELFAQARPHLVLLDMLMPQMDGFEAASRIKQMAGEHFVPVIFLTALSNTKAIARCLEVGDDVLPKPYDLTLLAAKIRVMERVRRLQQTVLQQRDVIASHNDYLLAEQRVAKAVFDKVAHSGCLNQPNIRYLQSPFALFNGDILLAAFKPSGGMHILLGDFTGHGLPAAIGAMPLAEVFYSMTSKGFTIAEILRELNVKLKRILPVGMFCCAAMVNISFQRRQLEIWNGGLPDAFLLPLEGAPIALASQHLPLGVLAAEAFNDQCLSYPMAPGDRLLLMSDGVVEARDAAGQMFGHARLFEAIHSLTGEQVFEHLQHALNAFLGSVQDDLSMLEVKMPLLGPAVQSSLLGAGSGQVNPLHWRAQLEYRGETLRSCNPLPALMQLLQDVDPLRARASEVYSVLAELYTNALEHGVLALDSQLKASAQGFDDYYQLRADRLAQLKEGYVGFNLNVEPRASGGRLTVQVYDSGAGFDVAQVLAAELPLENLCGRGLRLVQELSDTCVWREDGCLAEVEFNW